MPSSPPNDDLIAQFQRLRLSHRQAEQRLRQRHLSAERSFLQSNPTVLPTSSPAPSTVPLDRNATPLRIGDTVLLHTSGRVGSVDQAC